VVTLGEVARRYGPQLLAQSGTQLSDSQRQALRAIADCRTAALGGHVYACAACATVRYSYHSCRNRHCPACQQDAGQRWLAQQHALLLPVPYFLVTFTLPSQLRPLARQHPATVYHQLFRASAAALQQLAHDPRFLGGQIGMLGVVQTWTRDLRYHPHIHYLVPALALAPDGATWRIGKPRFFVPTKPLAQLFRAKLRAALRRLLPAARIPAVVWRTPWVIDCRPVGNGEAALKYLAPYIFRIALSNNRIERLCNDQVTFRYTEAATRQTKRATLPAVTFLRRFLDHVLPKGFVKVRYYGLLRLGNRRLLAQARTALALPAARGAAAAPPVTGTAAPRPETPSVTTCPTCGRPMQVVQTLPRQRRASTEPAHISAPCSRGPPCCSSRQPNTRTSPVAHAVAGAQRASEQATRGGDRSLAVVASTKYRCQGRVARELPASEGRMPP
jgi:hypothetical protein